MALSHNPTTTYTKLVHGILANEKGGLDSGTTVTIAANDPAPIKTSQRLKTKRGNNAHAH